MKHIEVVAAIIVHDDKILCTQRSVNKYEYISKKYEFPGGKVESGESLVDAIRREVREELIMDVSVGDKFLTVNHKYPDFELTMHSFICKSVDRSFTLTEHIDFKWLGVDELGDLDWAAADLPIVDKLMRGVDE